MTTEVFTAREAGTDRPVAIGRIELEDEYVILALRYLDGGGEWFPTWTGRKSEAVHIPRGTLVLAPAYEAALKEKEASL